MKILTNIPLRRDGTVWFEGGYTFLPDADGRVVCDVTDEAVIVKMLLRSEWFEPANEEDFEDAKALLAAHFEANAPAAATSDEIDDDDAGTEEVVNGGLPVESDTPPQAFKAPKRAKR